MEANHCSFFHYRNIHFQFNVHEEESSLVFFATSHHGRVGCGRLLYDYSSSINLPTRLLQFFNLTFQATANQISAGCSVLFCNKHIEEATERVD